jgi:hypothetical protein
MLILAIRNITATTSGIIRSVSVITIPGFEKRLASVVCEYPTNGDVNRKIKIVEVIVRDLTRLIFLASINAVTSVMSKSVNPDVSAFLLPNVLFRVRIVRILKTTHRIATIRIKITAKSGITRLTTSSEFIVDARDIAGTEPRRANMVATLKLFFMI